MKIAILYVPVLHEGYVRFMTAAAKDGVTQFYLPGPNLIKELTFLEPEIRAVAPPLMRKIITGLGLFESVSVVEAETLPTLAPGDVIVTANEGWSNRLIERYFPGQPVEYQTIWLRWDEVNIHSTQAAGYSRQSTDDFDRSIVELAEATAGHSGDWWRQVGAVMVKGWQVVSQAHNRHVPSQLAPYALGDPRDFVPAGESPEIATTLHAEQSVILDCARRGIGLQGTWLYVTIFPCSMCARLIAYSGIKRVYFRGGSASLEGQSILEQNGVELILVP